jgi:hypothetical protein
VEKENGIIMRAKAEWPGDGEKVRNIFVMPIKHINYVRIIYTVVCTSLQYIIEKKRFGHF